jgi:hypothetical protein
VRCGRCGNENAEANRFCGMCGAALVGKTQDVGKAPTADGPGGASAERRPAAVAPADTGEKTGPVITGPSFLGLNTPSGGGHSGRHADDPLRPSSNLEYLLEDEEPKRGGGKLILVMIALLLAVGFGYLHWKQGGFDWLNAGEKKPTAATPAAANGGDSGGTAGTAAAPSGAAPAGGASGPGTAPATGGTTANPMDSTGAQAAPGQAAPSQSAAQNAAAPSAVPQNPLSQNGASQNPAPQNKAGDPSTAESASPTAGSDSESKTPPAEPAAPEKPAARKPAAKPEAAKPADPVTTAERYIYGRGVRQDCDHGLRLLKPAAEQSNTKAMISLGALYSTGTCTPRDLPTAYHWFALALHKEPDNQALQDDLQKLWSQMTQPERQLAIKLSQ